MQAGSADVDGPQVQCRAETSELHTFQSNPRRSYVTKICLWLSAGIVLLCFAEMSAPLNPAAVVLAPMEAKLSHLELVHQRKLLAQSRLQIQPTPTIAAKPGKRFAGSQYPNSEVKDRWIVLDELPNIVAVHAMHIPGTDKYLYMERPSGNRPNNTMRQIAGTFDLVTRQWTPVDTPDGLFCAGHTYSSDGRIIIVGGHKQNAGFPAGLHSVRVYDYTKSPKRLIKTTNMTWGRWYPTPTLLADGRVLIMGGTQDVGAGAKRNPDFEVYDPWKPNQFPLRKYPVEATYLQAVTQNYYPFNFQLPTGDVFNFCSRISRILVSDTGRYRTVTSSNGTQVPVQGPRLPGSILTQFPYTSTAVFTALTPANNYSSVDLIVFGGAPTESNDNNTLIAGRWSNRMTISWSRKNSLSPWTYSFSKWVTEDMGIPRVMGDATLLPNGDVILLNGAQTGCAGDAAKGGLSRAHYPNLWAQLYQPDRPVRWRYTTLSASTIPRLYHSVAALTTNGTILVGGCDRCGKRVISGVPFVNMSRYMYEYRNEIYYPPYVYDTLNKPIIRTVAGNGDSTSVKYFGYNETFQITWGSMRKGIPSPGVTSVSLVAPSSCTHSFNFAQRVVVLKILSIDRFKGVINVVTPPNPFIATPMRYMLFIMNGKTYSRARWVHLVDKKGVAKSKPS